MAIQMRRGAYANLDKSKLVAGEIVMSTDTNYVGIAKAPSQVLQLATTDMLELPVASTNTLGGVIVGDNLSIDSNGRLSATGGGGGTTVIANPTGTATDDLTKIQIGQTIYGVEGGSGGAIEMTYAQYQALTPQQKMDGTVRYVADYPSGGGLPDYSTTEQRTGQKWIDGKDIYAKTLTSAITNISTTVNHGIENLDKVVDIKAIAEFVNASTGKSVFNTMRIAIGSSGTSVEPTYSNVVNSVSDTAIDIRVGSQVVNTVNYRSVNVYVTLYYTKN